MAVITMNRLLQNPTGPYSAYFARRDLTINDLTRRFLSLIKKHGDFKHEIFKDKDDFYFYFKVPSETQEKLFYDVVLQFYPAVESAKSDFTLNNYGVKMFSNAPNFLFTYAYTYNKDDLLIDFLKKKISDKALDEPPNVRNPIQSYGFEKSVYFSLLFLKNSRYNIKSVIMSKAKKINKSDLLKAVDSTDEKLKHYNRAKANEKSKKENKKLEKRVAKTSKTSYNEEVVSKSKKSMPKLEMKRNMKKDMSVKSKKRKK